jgi:hypothetical protein
MNNYEPLIKAILGGIVAYLISAGICKMIIKWSKKKEYEGYRDNRFWCTKCGRELTMAQTFYEVCPYCNDSYS